MWILEDDIILIPWVLNMSLDRKVGAPCWRLEKGEIKHPVMAGLSYFFSAVLIDKLMFYIFWPWKKTRNCRGTGRSSCCSNDFFCQLQIKSPVRKQSINSMYIKYSWYVINSSGQNGLNSKQAENGDWMGEIKNQTFVTIFISLLKELILILILLLINTTVETSS